MVEGGGCRGGGGGWRASRLKVAPAWREGQQDEGGGAAAPAAEKTRVEQWRRGGGGVWSGGACWDCRGACGCRWVGVHKAWVMNGMGVAVVDASGGGRAQGVDGRGWKGGEVCVFVCVRVRWQELAPGSRL